MSSIFAISGYATDIVELPYRISASGYYKLTRDVDFAGVEGYGITVSASDVVLDLNGFTIKSDLGTAAGIGTTSDARNVTIENGAITGFTSGHGLDLNSPEILVQNLRLIHNLSGIFAIGSNFDTIQDCFIVGRGAMSDYGVFIISCTGIVVKNNQIASANTGCSSNGGNSFIANQIASCSVGLELGTGDKYQGIVTNGCTTPFSGGTAVGDGNN
jgi:hypothetical protein